jgi:hypothetical protein
LSDSPHTGHSPAQSAEDLPWQRQRHCIVRPVTDVELVLVDVGTAKLIVACTGLLDLAGIDLEPDFGVIEAAMAGALKDESET